MSSIIALRRRRTQWRTKDENGTLARMRRKICRVTGLDLRGLPLSVLIEADSLFEAAAAGIEQVHKQKGLISEVQIDIQEAGTTHRVHPRQLEKWLRSHAPGESVGIRALKSRVNDILKNSPHR